MNNEKSIHLNDQDHTLYIANNSEIEISYIQNFKKLTYSTITVNYFLLKMLSIILEIQIYITHSLFPQGGNIEK